jgi:UDP-N-acetyl-D-glucosamine dehydrogenase
MGSSEVKQVAVIGLGYVGLPLLISSANAGWRVLGIDVSREIVENLNQGLSHIESIESKELKSTMAKLDISFKSDFSGVANSQIVIFCVPTPLDNKSRPDLTSLESAVNNCLPFLQDKTLVISESTSYPGTLREVIANTILNSQHTKDKEIYFAVAPERVNPGDPIWSNSNTPRLVAGINTHSTSLASEFYKSFTSHVIEVDTPEEAEAAKLLENSFRLVNISFINEFARICTAAGINSKRVIELAGTKPYGFMSFTPGIGAGGHCIPVDPVYFTEWARDVQEDSEILELAIEINRRQPEVVVRKALNLLGEYNSGPTVLLVGLTYKPGISDIRESPAIQIAQHLLEKGLNVLWHDPLITEWNGTYSQPITTDCSLIIFTVNQVNLDLDYLNSCKIPVLNCTNLEINCETVYNL